MAVVEASWCGSVNARGRAVTCSASEASAKFMLENNSFTSVQPSDIDVRIATNTRFPLHVYFREEIRYLKPMKMQTTNSRKSKSHV